MRVERIIERRNRAHIETFLLDLEVLQVGALFGDGLVIELEVAHSEPVLAALVAELVLHALEQRHSVGRELGVLDHHSKEQT